MLCDDQTGEMGVGGWNTGEGEGKAAPDGGHICIHIADLLCSTAEANTTL